MTKTCAIFIGFVCHFIDFLCEFTVKTTEHTVKFLTANKIHVEHVKQKNKKKSCLKVLFLHVW
jgi:hypothetical protein